MKARILIVDDEPLARARLLDWLRAEPDVEVIGECADGLAAVAALRKERPDLVLLDVQMGGLDGFGVLAALPEKERPVVVFVTAYDQFAVRAFEVHAVDYLLKPCDRERFQVALRRGLARVEAGQEEAMRRQLAALLADLRPADPSSERLAIKTDGKVVFVRLDEVDWLEAADNYVMVHAGAERHLLRETLNALEARLPRRQFLRISRSALVSLERIKEFHPLFHGDGVIVLRNGTRVNLSRNYREQFDKRSVQ